MAAPRNNWDVEYNLILFLEGALEGHDRVGSFSREHDIQFRIERRDGLAPVVAVLVNRYVISQADVMAAKAEFPEMECIVAHGAWCGYTREAKEYGMEQGLGVFIVTEFLGALWHKQPFRYVKKDHKGRPTYAYKVAS